MDSGGWNGQGASAGDADPGRPTGTAAFAIQQPSNLERLARIVVEKRWLIGLVVVPGALLSAVALFLTPRSYTASVQLRIERPASNGRAAPVVEEADIDTHLAMLGSDAHYMAILSEMDSREGQKGNGKATGSRANQNEEKRAYRILDLKRRIKVFQERRSHIVTISFKDKSPAKAADMANLAANAHIERLRESVRSDAERSLAYLGTAIERAASDLAKTEAAVKSHQARFGMSPGTTVDVATVADIRRQLSQAIIARASINAAGTATKSNEGRAEASARSDVPDGKAGTIQGRQFELADMQVRLLQRQLTVVQKIAGEASSERAQLLVLERKASAAAKVYEDLLRRRQDMSENAQLMPIGAHIVSPASVPITPSSINPLFLLPPATIAFLLLGIALAFAADRIDGTVRSEAQASEALGIRCIGRSVAAGDDQESSFASPTDPNSAAGIALRSVFDVALSGGNDDVSGYVVAVTSSVANEGSAALGAQLAACAARLGQRTLLIDLDPVSSIDDDTMEQGDGSFFDYLPGSALALEASRLTKSGLADALRPLRPVYHRIIILAPPVLASAEVQLLAAVADRTIFAIQFGKTQRDLARYALDRILSALGRARQDSVVAVLTRAEPDPRLAPPLENRSPAKSKPKAEVHEEGAGEELGGDAAKRCGDSKELILREAP